MHKKIIKPAKENRRAANPNRHVAQLTVHQLFVLPSFHADAAKHRAPNYRAENCEDGKFCIVKFRDACRNADELARAGEFGFRGASDYEARIPGLGIGLWVCRRLAERNGGAGASAGGSGSGAGSTATTGSGAAGGAR